MNEERYKSFKEFWPFYLSQHHQVLTRRLHYGGTLLALCVVSFSIYRHQAIWLILAPVAGYLPAWFAHFFIEKNRPATFKYPLYSLMGDAKMAWQALTGQPH